MRNLLSLSLLTLAIGCGQAETSSSTKEAWDYRNDPQIMGASYERKLERLPQSGRIASAAWADDYWANKNGGISYRWQTREIAYPFKSASSLSREDVSKLSPAEKFDLFKGDSNWSLTRYERMRTRVLATVPGSSEYVPGFAIPSWEGLCHGWAPAAILYAEPKAVTVTNPQGVDIEFAASDIKALLTYNIHSAAPIEKKLVGTRCESDSGSSHISCRDANAASFHLILANEVGTRKKSFIVDAVNSSQVWNHPVLGYSSRVGDLKNQVTPGAAPGTVYEVEVASDVTILVESSPHHNYLGGENRQYEQTKTYRYVLELNAAKEVIGGRWLSNEHPDFIWRQAVPSLSARLSGLEKLYKISTGQELPLGAPIAHPSLPSDTNGAPTWGGEGKPSRDTDFDDWVVN